ncbi:hypothetical protein [Noviherbaspirillum saxi]|uniref:hypothetical protein n=1 Tax=Noviherbaspirillum saxi TaxID=2320863 RepID=UPI0030836D1B
MESTHYTLEAIRACKPGCGPRAAAPYFFFPRKRVSKMDTRETNTGTTIDEIADGIFRVATPVPPEVIPGGFSFNQYLIVDDYPMLYHTGPRKLFSSICAAIEQVLPVSELSYIGFSHVEADECGSLNDFLERAPAAIPVCSQVAAMVSINDLALRSAKAMADGEVLELGRHRIRWIATPHLPHGWECSMAF